MASNDSQSTSPTTPAPGALLESFLQRAGPILASERGINAKSRLKLEALAREMNLDDKLFDEAIRKMQGAPPPEPKASRWAVAFAQYLHAKLDHIPRQILTSPLETRVIAVAVNKFQLDEQEAREVVKSVCAEKGIHRISLSEAERHVEELIEHKVADSAWLDDQTVTRLHAAGREWGLTSDQVDAVIRTYTQKNRRKEQRERKTTIAILFGSVVAVVAMVVGFIIFSLVNGSDPEKDGVDPGPNPGSSPIAQPGKEHEATPSTRTTPPDWWNDTLSVAITKARVNLPEFSSLYPRLATDSIPDRAEAYAELVKLANGADDRDRKFSLLRPILVGCESSDPSDESAQRLRTELLAPLAQAEDKLPTDSKIYPLAMRNSRLLIEALYDERTTDERATEIEADLGRSLGMTVSRKATFDQSRQLVQQALLERFYRQLIALGPSNVDLAYDLYRNLTSMAARLLEPVKFDRLEADFLAAALPVAGTNWRRFSSLIEKCIAARDPVNVLRVVDVYENSDDPILQSFLGRKLLGRFDVGTLATAPEDLAAAIREELGVSAPVTAASGRKRWEELEKLVKEQLAKARTSGPTDRATLESTIQLAYLSTLACALAQQEPGFPLYDQLRKDGAPKLEGKKDPFTDRGPLRRGPTLGVIATKRQRLMENVVLMRNYASMNPELRLAKLRTIADTASYLDDIAQGEANTIVSYILHVRNEREFERVLNESRKMARWPQFQLSLADRLVTTSMPRTMIEQLLSSIIGSKQRIGDVPDWREHARQRLLRSVTDKLSRYRPRASKDDPNELAGSGAEALTTLLSTQARLLGLPPGAYSNLASPGAAMDVLVSHQASELATALLPHELTTIDYLADNDLQRTVLLQRVRLELLAKKIAGMRDDKKAEADRLVAQLRQQNQQAADLLHQLQDGEVALLEMWMLLAP